ncbi:MAG: hypothetical protein QOF48_1334 [Verrucomicrobiota bacterium]|jgi:hypothetical protein
MRTPALAIGWSLWARHRTANGLLLAAIPFCALLYRAFFALIPERLAGGQGFLRELPLTLLPMALSFIWVFYVCGQTENDARKGFTGFPERLFVLPVRTVGLVAWHTLFGVAAIVFVHLAWAWLVFRPVGVHFEMRWPLLLSASAMMLFQGAVWGLASFPWVRTVALVAGGLAIGPLLVVTSIPGFDAHGLAPACVEGTVAAMPLIWVITVMLVAAERRGGWQPWRPMRRFAQRIFDRAIRRRSSFASASGALAWFEWRRKGWLVMAAVAVGVAGAVLMLPVHALLGGPMGLPPWATLLQAFVWPLFIGACLGWFLARPDFSGDIALPPFHAIKPMSSGQIVLIKLRVAMAATVAGWVLALPLTLAITIWPKWAELCHNEEFQEVLRWIRTDGSGAWWLAGMVAVTMVMTWQGMVEGISIGLTGRVKLIGWMTAIRLASIVAVVSVCLWWHRRPELLPRVAPWIYAGLVLVMIWKTAGLIRSLGEVRRRGLWTAKQLRLGVGLWSGVAAAMVLGTALILWKVPVATPLVLLGAVCLWPGGHIAQGVIHLAGNRHR